MYDTTFIPDGALISAAELNSNLTRLSRLSAGIDSGLVGKYIKRALALAGTNEIGCKEFVNFIHSLSRLNSGAFEGIDISPLMQELKAKLKNNRRFKLKMTSVDVAVCLNSITRLKDLSCEVGSLSTQIACALGDEIPCRISQFEDHHLAIILHCYSKFDIKDTVVIEEVLSEIELSRTLTNFTLQSTIMIAVACSRLAIHTLLVKNRDLVDGIWESIQIRLTSAKPNELQPKWADVALTSIAHSGIHPSAVSSAFVQSMVENIILQSRSGKITTDRVSRAISALLKMNVHPNIISRLMELR